MTILPRKGEVAGACQSEGAERNPVCCASSPSVTFGDTSPWRGRIVGVAPLYEDGRLEAVETNRAAFSTIETAKVRSA